MARQLKKVKKDDWAAVEANLATIDRFIQELNKRLKKYYWPTDGGDPVVRRTKGHIDKGAPPVPPTYP